MKGRARGRGRCVPPVSCQRHARSSRERERDSFLFILTGAHGHTYIYACEQHAVAPRRESRSSSRASSSSSRRGEKACARREGLRAPRQLARGRSSSWERQNDGGCHRCPVGGGREKDEDDSSSSRRWSCCDEMLPRAFLRRDGMLGGDGSALRRRMRRRRRRRTSVYGDTTGGIADRAG